MLRNAWIVGQREWAASFARLLAPGVLAAFLALVALLSLWLDDVLLGGVASLRGPHGWMATVLVLVMPALTMRSFAGSGVAEWEGTQPLSATDLVLGKWAAATLIGALGVGLTAPWALVISRYGDLDWGPVLSGYLGLLLLVCALAAVGVATSAWARGPALAFVAAVAVCSVLWLGGWALTVVPTGWVPVMQWLSLEHHLGGFTRGVLDSRSLVFFGGLTLVGLRFAVLALEHRRLA